MAAASSAQFTRFNVSNPPPLPSHKKPYIPFSSCSSFQSSPPKSLSFCFSLCRPTTLIKSPSFSHHRRCHRVCASIRKLSEAEPLSIAKAPEELDKSIPDTAGVYAVYDAKGELQFVGISRNIAASIEKHRKSVPAEICSSVKVGPADTAMPDRTVLQSAWKSWIEEHIAASSNPPPGNLPGNYTWIGAPPDLRLTPGRHVSLTVPLEELIDRLVKEHKVVAFIKGSRRAPQCGFSQKVVGILESHGVDFVSVDVLDEEHNFGLREKLKSYSNWPTFPQVFAGGELLGGCDIITDLAEKGELKAALQI